MLGKSGIEKPFSQEIFLVDQAQVLSVLFSNRSVRSWRLLQKCETILLFFSEATSRCKASSSQSSNSLNPPCSQCNPWPCLLTMFLCSFHSNGLSFQYQQSFRLWLQFHCQAIASRMSPSADTLLSIAPHPSFLSPWLEKQKGDIAISQMSGVSIGVGVGITNLVNTISQVS